MIIVTFQRSQPKARVRVLMFQWIGEELRLIFEILPLFQGLREISNPRVEGRGRYSKVLGIVDEIVGEDPSISRLDRLDLSDK